MPENETRTIHFFKTQGGKVFTGDIDTGGGDFIAGDQYVTQIITTPIKLGASHRVIFRDLIADYTKLFAGRANTLLKVREFIQDPAGGYLVITAPAGFGKTALTANLIAGQQEVFAYHFFAPLYGPRSLDEKFFLKNVVQQLAVWHDQAGQLPEDIHDLQALYEDLLVRPLPGTHILVLDGLDEVAGLDLARFRRPGGEAPPRWNLAPYLDATLPPGRKVIVTVRDVGQDLADAYRFPPDQTQFLPLDGLSRAGVAQVFQAAGPQAARFGQNPALLDQVMAVSVYAEFAAPAPPALSQLRGADPFYVNLLAQEAAAGHLTPENLSAQPRGLQKYLEGWLNQVASFADTESEAYANATLDLLFTLTVALGPIPRSDLVNLQESLGVIERGVRLFPRVIDRVRRFVKGDDDAGYALVHPRLRRHIQNHPNYDVSAYKAQLLAYCAGWPEHHSPYALTYYPEHLYLEGDYTALFALVDRSWKEALETRPGAQTALAEDLERALRAARELDPPDLAAAFRASLVYATLVSQSRTIPAPALEALAKLGQYDQALQQAQLFEDPAAKIKVYDRISRVFLERGQREAARRLWRGALPLLEAIEWGVDGQALVIARGLAAAGDLEAALELIDSLPLGAQGRDEIFYIPEQVEGWIILGEHYEALGILAQARALAEKAWNQAQWQEPADEIGRYDRRLAFLCCRVGLTETAGDILSRTPEAFDQTAIQAALAAALLGAGELGEGMFRLDAVSDPFEIRSILQEAGPRLDEAALLDEIVPYLETLGQEKEGDTALGTLARQLAEQGRWESALLILDHFGRPRPGAPPDARTPDWMLAGRVQGYLQLAGHAPPAPLLDGIIAKAEAAVEAIRDPARRLRSLARFPGALTSLGREAEAGEYAARLTAADAKLEGYLGTAQALIDLDRRTESWVPLAAAFGLVKKILPGTPAQTAYPLLVRLSNLAAEAGAAALALEVIERAGELGPAEPGVLIYTALAFSEVLEALGETGPLSLWLDRAVESARSGELWTRARVYSRAVLAAAEAGDERRVQDTLDWLQEAENSQLATQVAGTLAENDRPDLALPLMPAIIRQPEQRYLVIKVIRKLAEAGEFDAARELTAQLPSGWDQEQGYTALAAAHALRGDVKAVLINVGEIEQADRQAVALGQVALALAEGGQPDLAGKMAQFALDSGRTQVEDILKYPALVAAVVELAEAGWRAPAEAAAELAAPLMARQRDPDLWFSTLADLAGALVKVGAVARGRAVLGEILSGAADLDDERHDQAVIPTLDSYRTAEDGAGLAAALEAVRDPERRARLISIYAPAIAAYGQAAAAWRLVASLSEPEVRDRVYEAVCRELAQSGDLGRAHQTIEAIQGARARGRALAGIGAAQARVGDLEAAQAVVDRLAAADERAVRRAAHRVRKAVVLVHAQSGDLALAQDALGAFEEEADRADAWLALVVHLVQAGALDTVLEMLQHSPERWQTEDGPARMMRTLVAAGGAEALAARAGELPEAFVAMLAAALLNTGRSGLSAPLLDRITDPETLVQVYRVSRRALFREWRFPELERLLAGLTGSAYFISAAAETAAAALTAGETELAARLLNQAWEALGAAPASETAPQLRIAILRGFLALENETKIEEVLAEIDWRTVPDPVILEIVLRVLRVLPFEGALAILESLEPPARQYHLMLQVVGGLMNMGREEEAGPLAEAALAGLWVLGEAADLPDPVAAVALGMAQAGQIPLIPAVIDLLEPGPSRDAAILQIVQSLIALHALQAAWTVADAYLDPFSQGVAYAALARAYARRGAREEVLTLAQEARKLLNQDKKAGETRQRAAAWIGLSRALAHSAQTEAAQEAAAEARALVEALPADSGERLVLTARLALAWAAAGAAAQAGDLAGQAGAALAASYSPEDEAAARLALAEVNALAGDRTAALDQVDRALALRNPFWDPQQLEFVEAGGWRVLLALHLDESEFTERVPASEGPQRADLGELVVRALVERFDMPLAVAAAGRFEVAEAVGDAARRLAAQLAKDGDIERAVALLRDPVGAGPIGGLGRVALALLGGGWLAAALQVAAAMAAGLGQLQTLVQVHRHMWDVYGAETAVGIWDLALENPRRSQMWHALYDEFLARGQFGHAVEMAEASGDEGAFQHALRLEALAQAKAGYYEDAADMVGEMILKDYELQDAAFRDIARVALDQGQVDTALRTLERIADDWARNYAIGEAAMDLAERGELAAARYTLARIADPAQAFRAQGQVAKAALARGETLLPPEEILAALDAARTQGRDALFRTLASAAPVLAAEARGQVLLAMVEAVVEVDAWWA